jgi:hypothetical protein
VVSGFCYSDLTDSDEIDLLLLLLSLAVDLSSYCFLYLPAVYLTGVTVFVFPLPIL